MMDEAFLEPTLRNMRLKRVLPFIKKYKGCQLLDIGCGWEAKLLKEVEPYISSGFGIDFKAPELKTDKIETKRIALQDSLPFEDNSFDVVTLMAVLEHLSDPVSIVNEIARILKKNGRLILTVPSRQSKPVLEFLAYQMKIISETEIRDHKKYYNYKDLVDLFNEIDELKIEKHNYFQFYMNNFCIVKKCK